VNNAPHRRRSMKHWPRWGKRLGVAALFLVTLWLGVIWVLPWQAVVTGEVQRLVAGMPLQIDIDGEPRLRPRLTGVLVLFDVVRVQPAGMNATVTAHRPEVFLTWWRLLRRGEAGIEGGIPRVDIKVGNSLTVIEDMTVTLGRPMVDQLTAVGVYRWSKRMYRYDVALKFFSEHHAMQFSAVASSFASRAVEVRLVGAALWQGDLVVVKLRDGVFPGGTLTGSLRLQDHNDIVLIDGLLQYKNDQMSLGKEKGFFEFRDVMAMAGFLSGAALSGRVRVGMDVSFLQAANIDLHLRPDQPLLILGQGRTPQGEISGRAVVEGGLDQWQIRDASIILGTEELIISAVKRDKGTDITVVGQGWKTWPILETEPISILKTVRDAEAPVTVHFHMNNTVLAGRSLALIRGMATLGKKRFDVDPLVVVPREDEQSRLHGAIGLDADRLVPMVTARMEGDASALTALVGSSLPLALGQGGVRAEIQGILPYVPMTMTWTNEVAQTIIKGTLELARSQPVFSGTLTSQRSAAPILNLQGPVQTAGDGVQVGPLQGTMAGQPLHLDITVPWTVEKPLTLHGTAGRLSVRDVAGLLPISEPVSRIQCPALAGEAATTLPLQSLLVNKPWQVSLRLAEMSGVRVWRNVVVEGGGTGQGMQLNVKANADNGVAEAAVRLNSSGQGGMPQLAMAVRVRGMPVEVGVGRASVTGSAILAGATACLSDMLDVGVGKVALTAQGVTVRGLALQGLLGLLRNTQGVGDGTLMLGDAQLSGRLASGRLEVDSLIGHFTGGSLVASGQYQVRDGLMNGRAALRFAAYPQAPPLELDFGGHWNAPRIGLADKKFAIFLLQKGILARENALGR
jgi:hypothetical protein